MIFIHHCKKLYGFESHMSFGSVDSGPGSSNHSRRTDRGNDDRCYQFGMGGSIRKQTRKTRVSQLRGVEKIGGNCLPISSKRATRASLGDKLPPLES